MKNLRGREFIETNRKILEIEQDKQIRDKAESIWG